MVYRYILPSQIDRREGRSEHTFFGVALSI